MVCKECYWCAPNKSIGNEMCCCNQDSENYNKIFTREEVETMECKDAETKMAVDYRTMSAWEFTSRYWGR